MTDLGKVGILPRGTWVQGLLYEFNDIVSHKGSSYLALKDNAVEPSDDGINWMLMAQGENVKLDSEILENSKNAVEGGALYKSFSRKVDIEQGSENAGKFLKINEIGQVFPGEMVVDDALSKESVNPVQNKVVSETLELKGDTICYDENTSMLQLKSGTIVLSEVEIVGSSALKSTIYVTTTANELFGQTVTCTGGDETLTSTFDESGKCNFKVGNLGEYTLTCGKYSTIVHVESLPYVYNAEIQRIKTVNDMELPFTFVCKGVEMFGETIVWRAVKRNHAGYPDNSILCHSDKGIAFLPYDAAENENSNANQRVNGNERWSYSNMRQWLNSDKAAGQWYTAQHSVDAPPSDDNVLDGYGVYEQMPGFLNGFPDDFKSLLLETTLRCGYFGASASSILYESVKDRVFLPSFSELSTEQVGTNSPIKSGEGTCYMNEEYLMAQIEATDTAWAHLGYVPHTKESSAVTRTPVGYGQIGYGRTNYFYGMNCNTNGVKDWLETRTLGLALSPFINLDSLKAKFSEKPNADGHYELIL